MIRRPLCYFAAFFTAGILLRYLLTCSEAAAVAAGICAAAFLWVMASAGRRRVRQFLIVTGLAVLVGCFVMQLAMTEAAHDPFAEKDGQAAKIQGMVISCESLRDTDQVQTGYRLVILSDEGSRVLADYDGKLPDTVLEGRRIEGAGEVSLPPTARNPGCFDYAEYLKGRRIYARLHLEKASTGQVESSWRHFFACSRQRLLRSLAGYLDQEQEAVLNAMLFGDKSMLSEDVYSAFQRNGTAHALAVSGLHVGMLYGMYVWFFGRKRTVSGTAVLVVLLLSYTALAEFSPSVVRAVTMIGVHTAARLLHARYDMLTGAAVSGVLILAVSPYQLFAGGFQLSFLAVLLLAFVQPVCEKRLQPALLAWLRRRGVSLRAAGTVGVVCRWLIPLFLMQAGMMPLTAFLFNYVSFSSFFVNLPLVVIAGMIVPAGILLLSALQLPFGMLFLPLGGNILAVLLDGLLLWNRLSYMEDAFAFDVVSPPRPLLILLYAALFFLLSEWVQIRLSRKEWKRLAAACLLLLCAGLCMAAGTADGFACADAVFVDVGQGDCVHVRGADADILFDGGGKEGYDVGRKVVKPYLLKNQVRRLDAAFATHLDTDHYAGIVSLCQDGMVGKLIIYKGHASELPAIMEETGLPADRIILAGPGDEFRFGDVRVVCLGPLEKSSSENEQSLVLLVEKEGRSVLITGDIGTDTEEKLAETYYNGDMDADILQIPHHGSRYSSSQALIEAVTPAAAVAQTGYNHYGHPAEEVIARYETAGTYVFRNDLDGAVGIDFSRMRVVTMIRR